MDKSTRRLKFFGRRAAPAANSQKAATFIEHIEELGLRVRNSALILLAFSILSLAFADQILSFIIRPYGEKLTVIGPTEGFSILIKVGLTVGASLASPFVIYQIIAFVAPGLEPHEKRPVYFAVPAAFFLFLLGAAFAWFIMIPAAVDFLKNFGADIFKVSWTADKFVPFVLALVFWIGVSFESPLLFMFLGRLGIVSPRLLLRGWRIAIVTIAIIAAMITPTVDPFNMFLVMAPLIGLYFLSILLTAFTYRKRSNT